MNAQFAKVTFSIHLLQRRTLRTAKNYKEKDLQTCQSH